MTIIEETGKEPTCPVCGSPDYGDCGHLVADLDRSFCECQGGELYEKMAEFLNLVEKGDLKISYKTIGTKWPIKIDIVENYSK